MTVELPKDAEGREISLRNLFSIAEETAIDVRDLVVEVDE